VLLTVLLFDAESMAAPAGTCAVIVHVADAAVSSNVYTVEETGTKLPSVDCVMVTSVGRNCVTAFEKVAVMGMGSVPEGEATIVVKTTVGAVSSC